MWIVRFLQISSAGLAKSKVYWQCGICRWISEALGATQETTLIPAFYGARKMADTLADIRRKIDALDARLIKLLSARAKLAQRVGTVKNGASAYRPEREAQVLRRVAELNRGPLTGDMLRRIYAEIMSACRALEGMLAVAYLGPEGTF